MSDTKFSDEQLQAFVDDEIDVSDRTEIMEAVARDEELACRVCELLQLKDSVKLAYREPPQPAHTNNRWETARKIRGPLKAVAAVLIFAMGTLTGVVLQTQTSETSVVAANGIARVTHAATKELKRVILHISTADPERLAQALNDAEELLSDYKDEPQKVQLEVVVNSAGLSLLRADASPYPERIRHMAREYSNVSFLACSRAIEKLRMKGLDVHLLPEARVIPGALEQIVDRLQDGWVYIRV